MKIVYFAGLRRQIGIGEELVELPSGIDRVDSLLAWLKQRSPAHRDALEGCARLMVAINQDYAALDSRIAAGDEVAFFPPVTGG